MTGPSAVPPTATAVLVHGAWGHPGDWDDVVAGLADAGVTTAMAERDASLPARLQRDQAARCERVIEIDSGHMVVHEHPATVTDLLVELARPAAP